MYVYVFMYVCVLNYVHCMLYIKVLTYMFMSTSAMCFLSCFVVVFIHEGSGEKIEESLQLTDTIHTMKAFLSRKHIRPAETISLSFSGMFTYLAIQMYVRASIGQM